MKLSADRAPPADAGETHPATWRVPPAGGRPPAIATKRGGGLAGRQIQRCSRGVTGWQTTLSPRNVRAMTSDGISPWRRERLGLDRLTSHNIPSTPSGGVPTLAGDLRRSLTVGNVVALWAEGSIPAELPSPHVQRVDAACATRLAKVGGRDVDIGGESGAGRPQVYAESLIQGGA